jgi:hypothetical protein
MANAFIYRPLDPTGEEIRLVEPLLVDTALSEMTFTIRHVKLSESPRYWTLSYTWGAPFAGMSSDWDSPNATHTISIDGRKFEVRWNLEAVLRMLRYYEVEKIWIDAICIDQSNMQEKNLQVQMMGEIYRNAVSSLVWLGPDSDDSDKALEGISRAFQCWNQLPRELQHGLLAEEDRTHYEQFARPYLEHEETLSEINAISRLLKRSWFRRVWIVQEAALSKSVAVLWGSDGRCAAYWDSLDCTLKLLRQHLYSCSLINTLQIDRNYLIQALVDVGNSAIFFARINDLMLVRHQVNDLGLTNIFSALKPFNSSDSKDRVYAGLGMSSKQNIMAVDYELNESEVYIAFTRAWLEKTNDLEALSLWRPSKIPNFPSWAIEFSATDSIRPLGSSWIVNSTSQLYRAGGKDPPSFRFENEKTLSICGIPLGLLSFVGDPAARLNFLGPTIDGTENEGHVIDYAALQRAWQGEWMGSQPVGPMKDSLERYLWTGELPWKAFARTTCADFFDPSTPHQTLHRLGEDFSFTKEDLNLMFRNVQYGRILDGRVFAATSLDHYCLVEEHAQVGDAVFIAVGAETPYVLRPKGNYEYQFVGYCYVHGFMDGEATKWMKRSDDGILIAPEFKIV